MKQAIALIALALVLCSQSFAWVSSSPAEKDYKFKFKLDKETYEYQMKANTYEDAYEKAAQACFTHFKAGRRVSEDRGLDIIDVCANPRTI